MWNFCTSFWSRCSLALLLFWFRLSVRLMSTIEEVLTLGGNLPLQLPEEIGHGRLVRISRYKRAH